jgi:hypothetical protein
MLYVEVLNKRCNAGGRTFCNAIINNTKKDQRLVRFYIEPNNSSGLELPLR